MITDIPSPRNDVVMGVVCGIAFCMYVISSASQEKAIGVMHGLDCICQQVDQLPIP